jgi:hypothetical protein
MLLDLVVEFRDRVIELKDDPHNVQHVQAMREDHRLICYQR